MIAREYLEAFQLELNTLKSGWVIQNGYLSGPEEVRLNFLQLHAAESPGHTDLEFVFQDASADFVHLYDCISGFGQTVEDQAKSAATIWASTTAPALLELKYSRQGKYADHYQFDDKYGFTGWHSICGAIMGYGHGESPQKLQDWWLNNPILPSLASVLNDSLDEQNAPYGIKIFSVVMKLPRLE
jgi:hypothetical protein